jgi:hypothetical protein
VSARWFALDAALVVVFATIGRASHEESLSLGGIAHTAWPFLISLALGWLGVTLRGWAVTSVWSGLVLWLTTVVGGMVLRAVSHQGTDPAFIVVATLFVGACLVGWRGVYRLTTR